MGQNDAMADSGANEMILGVSERDAERHRASAFVG